MTNRKNTLALISLLAGVLCLLYYVTLQGKISTDYFFTSPEIMRPEFFSYVICAIALLQAGISGLSTCNGFMRKVSYIAALFMCVISCVLTPTALISYFAVVISLVNVIVQFADKSPDKKLFFVYGKGSIYIVFDTVRPSYESVAALHEQKRALNRKNLETPENGESENRKTVKEEKVKHSDKPVQSARVKRLKKIKKPIGYAISPNGKRYRKKLRKKRAG
ncbi:MAG: hypothetical protein IJO93_02570 [Clostridia bacterium]|nr:hypothetical protein [Clostridia bacterium]